ncbi:mechanosensitive ion channel protein 1, mitochondrial [Physcomitrium patens]|uniref:Mechanosensitive ion channel MscS domain-containing protein n=1 Tax=Physcomitrium patens TaxID=3218 RepID=A0A2K1K3X6_PHYPA|nr:mechanosensitive ion channel protein 1, mitochondrial-like [Physcomitrium patens]XP_024383679.1 mechanosensitive ion channel protein 1, mitochondrial-like [Physcomitrium patens]XP_024383680.1 mechanosensitive ion channel protein 1, mitochondrial-like [Physcomitrium patens]PNR48481.1 hypothetical protein PHYPA_012958 [Physcomitrium patens]|eukprot:XP_024383678.1 mechanosensitive ion channel protein 1, mitochondrial-like [Physcomitrella patens]
MIQVTRIHFFKKCSVIPEHGVATAFAARDILGTILSGEALQFSRPFIVGDIISAGSVTGQVVDMDLHTAQLLISDKLPIVVPNSFFSNQMVVSPAVIINKSRARYRGLSFNLQVNIQDHEMIPIITSEISKLIMSHPKVYLENEKLQCHVSQVGPTSLNIVVTCNLNPMATDDYLAAQEDLLIEAARIFAKTGVKFGNLV